MSTPPMCSTFWGSHGCDNPLGHDGPHQCGGEDESADWDAPESPCSRFYGTAGEEGEVRTAQFDDHGRFVGWSEPWVSASSA